MAPEPYVSLWTLRWTVPSPYWACGACGLREEGVRRVMRVSLALSPPTTRARSPAAAEGMSGLSPADPAVTTTAILWSLLPAPPPSTGGILRASK